MPDTVAARPLPEFTRALRAFAAVDVLGTRPHDLVFGPFLAARRAAHAASSLPQQLGAFDVAKLRAALESAIDTIAAERWPRSDADRRAMRARLMDAATPVWEAMTQAGRASAWLSGVGDADRDGCFARWVETWQAVFRALDRCWSDIVPALGPAQLVAGGPR